jgi:hypothetical protein
MKYDEIPAGVKGRPGITWNEQHLKQKKTSYRATEQKTVGAI